MTLDLIIPSISAHHARWEECVGSWGYLPLFAGYGKDGVLPAMQHGYMISVADILAYVHDDVICREPEWRERVLHEFEDPTVGVVGFGGALVLGRDSLYREPYHITQLARDGYASNVDDAEIHGERFVGSRDVAVLDGFSLIVRRTLLDRLGGFPVAAYPPHHVYDMWLCASAHRLGARVRLLGVRCHHLGGRTATTRAYQEWASSTSWGGDSEMHRRGHRLFYDEFRGLLPIRIPRGTHESSFPPHNCLLSGEEPGVLPSVGPQGETDRVDDAGLRRSEDADRVRGEGQ